MSSLRVGIIGARRVRQGLGPFVARELAAAGAQVPCVLGTSADSAQAAAAQLAPTLGAPPRAYAELAAMLAGEELHALAVLAPHAAHAGYLEAAAAAGLHVLCEKPLVWGCERPAARARSIVERFGREGLVLVENCQWPYLLPFYDLLHPGSLGRPPQRFCMRLAPESTTPAEMLVDTLHHPLSCLQALVPGEVGGVEDASFVFAPADAGSGREPRLELRCTYRRAGRRVAVEIVLERSRTLPRPAGLGLDGGWAERSVRLPEYAIYLTAGDRAVPVRDPLAALIQSFVEELRAVRAGRPGPLPTETIRRDIVQRMDALETLVCAYTSRG